LGAEEIIRAIFPKIIYYELIFNMLGEAATTRITKTKDAEGFEENKIAAIQGGEVSR